MSKIKAKQVRKHLKKEIGRGMDVLHHLVRRRPAWIPKFIWLILYLPLFKRKDLKHISKYI